MFSDFAFSLQITAPIFIIIGLGFLFKKIGWINNEFAGMGSALVFKVTLPCLLFVKLSQADFTHGLPLVLIGYAVLATTAVFLALEFFGTPMIRERSSRGVFVQGAFRSNMAIIGLAFCISAFGEHIVGIVSVYLAVLTVLFNVLSIITLSRHADTGGQTRIVNFVSDIMRNPIVIAITLGVFVSVLDMPIPDIALHTGEYFARMTLPLALVCAGASIRLSELHSSPALYWASAMKLVFVPAVITGGGILVGLRGEELGVLYLLCACPTAIASYPMARTMHGNHYLAAAIIAVTSIGSIVFTTMGIFFLRYFGLI